MGAPVFQGQIEGHLVRVAVSALAVWEARAWVEQAALGVGIAIAIGVAVHGGIRGRTKGARVAGAALPAGAAFIALVFAGLAARSSGLSACEHGARGNVLQLFDGLAARFASVELLSWATVGLGIGLALGVLLDVPAWMDRAFRAQLLRLVLALVAGALGVGSLLSASDALARRDELAAIGPLPQVREAEAFRLHRGQAMEHRLEHVEALGLRRPPAALLIFPRPPFVVERPGSPEDQARLEAREHFHVGLESEDATAWNARMIHLEAPPEAGPFDVPLSFERGGIEVDASVRAEAIDDTPDPLFPLEVGTDRVYARSWQARSGSVRDDGQVRIRVRGEAVVDGFRELTVEIVGTPPEDSDDLATPQAFRRLVHLIPWEGTYRVRTSDEARAFVEPVERPQGAADEGAGVPCQLDVIDGATCVCVEEPPAGPRRCVHSHTRAGGNLLLVALGILTAGVTWMAGATPTDGPLTELRLIEAEGEPVDTPTRLEQGRPGRRRRH